MSGQDEDACPDNAADAERHEVERGQGPPQKMRLVVRTVGADGFAQQRCGRFAGPEVCHDAHRRE